MLSSRIKTYREGNALSLLHRCTALEGLEIVGSGGFPFLFIESSTLRTIGVSCRLHGSIRGGIDEFQVLAIHDTPCLESLILLDPTSPTTIWVHGAPKLTVLVYTSTRNSLLSIRDITIEVQYNSLLIDTNILLLYYS